MQRRSQDFSSLPQQSKSAATEISGPIQENRMPEALKPGRCKQVSADPRISRNSSVSRANNCQALNMLAEYAASESTLSGEEVSREGKHGINLTPPENELGPRSQKSASTRILLDKPASNYCHICSLYARGPIACKNNNCSNRSRKVICERCVKKRGWDMERLKKRDNWSCTHCRGVRFNAQSSFPASPKTF